MEYIQFLRNAHHKEPALFSQLKWKPKLSRPGQASQSQWHIQIQGDGGDGATALESADVYWVEQGESLFIKLQGRRPVHVKFITKPLLQTEILPQ